MVESDGDKKRLSRAQDLSFWKNPRKFTYAHVYDYVGIRKESSVEKAES